MSVNKGIKLRNNFQAGALALCAWFLLSCDHFFDTKQIDTENFDSSAAQQLCNYISIGDRWRFTEEVKKYKISEFDQKNSEELIRCVIDSSFGDYWLPLVSNNMAPSTTYSGVPLWSWAIHNAPISDLSQIISEAALDTTSDVFIALRVAAYAGRVDFMENFINSVEFNSQVTSIAFAAVLGRQANVLLYFADSGVTSPCFDSAVSLLTQAVYQDDIASAAILIKKLGCSTEQRGELKETPLMIAATRGNFDMVALLLDAGADPNAVDQFGYSSLMRAAARGKVNIVAALLQAGSDKKAKIGGISVRQIALNNGHNAVVELIDSNNPK